MVLNFSICFESAAQIILLMEHHIDATEALLEGYNRPIPWCVRVKETNTIAVTDEAMAYFRDMEPVYRGKKVMRFVFRVALPVPLVSNLLRYAQLRLCIPQLAF